MIAKLSTIALAATLVPTLALAQAPKTPEDFADALAKGFQIAAVVGQGDTGTDHVIYMRRGDETIVCGFRFVLTDLGFDAKQSKNLGTCTGFVGAK